MQTFIKLYSLTTHFFEQWGVFFNSGELKNKKGQALCFDVINDN